MNGGWGTPFFMYLCINDCMVVIKLNWFLAFFNC